jgi:hypothetical protein
MADFFARVELHHAQWPQDYTALHTALAVHGFTNRIVSNQGEKRLPSGFYFSTNRIDDVQQVATAVRACADSTGYANEVIVIRSSPPNPWRGYLSNI